MIEVLFLILIQQAPIAGPIQLFSMGATFYFGIRAIRNPKERIFGCAWLVVLAIASQIFAALHFLWEILVWLVIDLESGVKRNLDSVTSDVWIGVFFPIFLACINCAIALVFISIVLRKALVGVEIDSTNTPRSKRR